MCLLERVHTVRVLDVLLWILYFKAEIRMQNRWSFNDSLTACLLDVCDGRKTAHCLSFSPFLSILSEFCRGYEC